MVGVEGGFAGAVTSGARNAKFAIGAIVRHRFFPFRGVIFDVDPTFENSEEWWLAIPENVRPAKDQPYYHLLAENADTTYEAYVSEQNLLPDETGEPCRHPLVDRLFKGPSNGRYAPRRKLARPGAGATGSPAPGWPDLGGHWTGAAVAK